VVAERIWGVVDPKAPGNPERVAAWRRGLEVWTTGPAVIGTGTGLATQATAKLFPTVETINVESGVVQQLVKFGLAWSRGFLRSFGKSNRGGGRKS